MKTYFTLDNGGAPFKVVIDGDYVCIFKQCLDGYSDYPILSYKPKSIFVGEDTTEPGNSILLHIRDKKYVFVGVQIISFEALSDITVLKSPVGNNSVPYPFAIDKHGNRYLFEENVVLTKSMSLDPYSEYYSQQSITQASFKGITNYFVNGEKYELLFYPRPTFQSNQQHQLGYRNGSSKIMTPAQLKKLNQTYGALHGFLPLPNRKVLVKRSV